MSFDPAQPIYLDHNASTFLEPVVFAAMEPFLTRHQGNPSSGHALGRHSRRAIDLAREQAAALLRVEPDEVYFTSGGTESNNHALIGSALARKDKGDHIVVSAIEHPAVGNVCTFLSHQGFRITEIPVSAQGVVDHEAVAAACTDRTILVSVMLANNEVGSLQPVAAIAADARRRGIWFHTDAAQAVGKIPVHAAELGVQMVSVAGHKFHGPKGIGLLVIRDGADPDNLMHGAGHEGGRRPGTENVAAIVGLGAACQLAAERLAEGSPVRIQALRDDLEGKLLDAIPRAVIHARSAPRLPNTTSVGFPGLIGPDLMAAMPEIAVSAGAACHGDRVVASHVLKAMGVPADVAAGTLRLSLGASTSQADIDTALAALVRAAGGPAG
ncbi:cysteine desulfurase NifS [bacterium CG_4_9_14_3_um_filter_65_15]|nr:MAG: cysteine desulfurase NifS [bacterium CG_4_9_14_3_um_filter_65_15]